MVFSLPTLSYALAFFSLPSFTQWINSYNRSYNSAQEYASRQNIYLANLIKIAKHNSENHTWTMGVNNFTDLTSSEFKQQYSGRYRARPTYDSLEGFGDILENVTALPTYVNWTEMGAVTPVKNQGQCGSCWAFSTTGSVEGSTFLSTQKLVSLSEQQLVDCSGAEGNQGCNGGLMDYGFQYIINNKGITSESNYPYNAANNNCNINETKNVVASISGFKDVPVNSESALMTAIAMQPVSVAVEADQDSFQLYSGGVMTAKCGSNLDHGVLAVGYGTLGNEDYWIVKNSWGADWGMNGYILLGRGPQYGSSGQCGIQMDPSYPIFKN
jgi:C1A family cysteine protease